ncbi:MAG: heme-copper oxidase subunit III [Flavobacteriales bacterium]|jgi:cytochrome c oxidase subunit 3|nr:heme-copper oxidase subunit III [Flavobacteriales bacterium]
MNTAKNKALKQLLWVGMGSIAMFFAGLTSAYIVRKAEGNWVDFILPEWFVYSTIVIVISSLLLIIATQRIKKNKEIFALILSVFLLGGLFTYLQINGWKELTSMGVYLTGVGSNVAGSFLYVLTLSHLVHLAGGLIALFVAAIHVKTKKYTSESFLGLEITAIYWHFLSILWLYLFFFLKYL